MSRQGIAGFGGLRRLGSLAERLGGRRIAFVIGQSSYERSGARATIRSMIDVTPTLFFVVDSTPTPDSVRRCAAALRCFEHDVIVAIGGGRVLDTAKLAAVCAAQCLDELEVLQGLHANLRRGRPVIAIPTTAGSGAERTPFAVFYHNARKGSLDHKFVRPSAYILDSRLTDTVPASVAASSWTDAVSHCIESYWSVSSTPSSRRRAIGALRVLLDNITKVVCNRTPRSNSALLAAASEAGASIAVTRTTACHALSYGLTGRFGIAHGQAVGVLLAAVFVANCRCDESNVNDGRGIPWVRKRLTELAGVLGASTTAAAASRIRTLLTDIGLESSLTGLGLAEKNLKSLVSSIDQARLNNNPVILSLENCRSIFRASL